MAADRAGLPQPGAGIAVAVAIDDQRLADRVVTALRRMPELDVFSADDGEGDAAEIIITDRVPESGHDRSEAVLICLLDRNEVAAALRAGAAAVVPRSAGSAELGLAIAAVQHGLLVAPAGSLPAFEPDEGFAAVGGVDDGPAVLTERERQVLRLMAEGASNKQIARRLGVSVHTAKFHVASILDKLDATGRTDAVAHAVRLGLLLL
jgi:DNA-binding NarL/FixJ family response regulator